MRCLHRIQRGLKRHIQKRGYRRDSGAVYVLHRVWARLRDLNEILCDYYRRGRKEAALTALHLWVLVEAEPFVRLLCPPLLTRVAARERGAQLAPPSL